MNLADYKKQYPIYENVDDSVLAKAIHEKYYSGTDFNTFAQAIEYEIPKVEPVPEPERTIDGTIKDVGISALKSAIGVPQTVVGLADIVTGGKAGKLVQEAGVDFKAANEALDSYKSPAQQAAESKVSNADGFFDTAKAAIQNPSAIASSVGESLGSMGAGGVASKGVGLLAPKLAGWAKGAIGEGIAGAGAAAEGTRQQTADGELTGKQSALAVASGAGTSLFGAIGGKLAQKFGIDDIDTALADGAGQLVKSNKGLARRIAEGGISEGVFEELPQSVQEQMLSNIALDKPLTEGVANAAAMGMLSGGVMGAGAQFIPRGNGKDKLIVGADEFTANADDALAAQKQAEYDAEIKDVAIVEGKAQSDAALLKIQDATLLEDAIAYAQEAINTPISSPNNLEKLKTSEALDAADLLGEANGQTDNTATNLVDGNSGVELNEPIAGAGNELLLPSDTSSERLGSDAETLAPSGEYDLPVGTASDANETLASPFSSADDGFLTQMRGMTTDAKILAQLDSEIEARGLPKQSNTVDVPAQTVTSTEEPEVKTTSKKKSKAGTLLGTLNELGGISTADRLDVTGESNYSNIGYGKTFKSAAKTGLKSHIESGDLDQYLPPQMRLESNGMNDDAFDSTPAYDYLAERIRNGERVLPFDAEQEIKLSKAYAEQDIQNDIGYDELTDDEVNARLQRAGYDERESTTEQQDFDQSRDIQTTGNVEQVSANIGIVGDERSDTGTQREIVSAPTVQSTPQQAGTNQGIRDQVALITKRRAAATQIGKAKQFDQYLQAAKEYLAGGKPNASKFKLAASAFKADPALSQAFLALNEMANPAAKSERAEKKNAVETYKQIIANAKTVTELQAIAKDIQAETTFSDTKVAELDDLVFEAMDALDNVDDADTSAESVDETEKNRQEPVSTNENDFSLATQTNADIEAAEKAAKEASAAEIQASKKAAEDESERALKEQQRKNAGERDFTFGEDKKVAEAAIKTGMDDIFANNATALAAIKASDDITKSEKIKLAADLRKGDITAEDVTSIVAPIEDFGEKISGAKKEYAQAYKDKVEKSRELDIAAEPLSKTWPEPDYDKLLEAGTDPYTVAFIHAARDEIPTKPQKGYKLSRYVEAVKSLRDMADRAFTDNDYAASLKDKVSQSKFVEGYVGGRAELYQLVGHSKTLKGVNMKRHSYSIYNGEKFSPAKTVWEIQRNSKASVFSSMPYTIAFGDTKEQAMEKFQDAYNKINTEKEGTPLTKFGIYAKLFAKSDEKGQFYIGKKVGRNVLKIKEGFNTAKEARAYVAENNAELVTKLEALKSVPNERYDINQPRVGADMRGGLDVTSEMFGDAFGFRGVQFGNYVEGKRRQKDLNDAYDALMDMAALLDIPPKSISLNGELGLAFGARGSGGVSPAAAHYERGEVVINLTKMNGAGSLGHEWFHALDNYFSRMGGKAGDMVTEGARTDGNVRPEMLDAFKQIESAVKQTAIKQRSNVLDGRRSKAYWGTDVEIAARTFEKYLIAKLQDQGLSNDYLANVVSEEYWNASENLGIEEGGTYPYPTVAELPVIRAAYDNFFNVIETKVAEDGKVALFSRTTATKEAYETRIDELFNGGKASYGLNSAIVLDKSDMLDLLGFGDKPLYLNEGKVIQGQEKHPNVTADVWKKVPEWIENPAMVFDSDDKIAKNVGRLVFVAPEQINNNPVLIIIEPNADAKGIKVDLLVNAYDKDTSYPPLRNWVEDKDLLRYYNKAKSPAILARSGLQLSSLARARSSSGKILRDSDLVKYRAQNNPALSRNDGYGLPLAEVQSIVDQLKSKWKNAPEIIVVNDMTDTAIREVVRNENERQLSQGAEGQPEGFFDAGKVYVVVSEMRSADDVRRVIFHETLGHYGLRGVFGKDLKRILREIGLARRKELIAKAKQYGLDINNESDRLIAAEELLAEMAQTYPEIGFVKRTIAAIRTWLRDNGFDLELTDSEIIRSYIEPARTYVSNRVKAESSGGMLPAFARAKAGASQTDSPEFKKWFGDSKVVDDDGNALVVYHGTTQSFSSFKDKNQRQGSYFAEDRKYAELFTEQNAGNGGNIMPVYLSIKNPAEMRDGISAKLYEDLEAHGYDTSVFASYTPDDYWGLFDGYTELSDALKAAGYDGVKLTEPQTEGSGANSWLAFNPNQIKSAIGNNGNFDGGNNNILFSRASNPAATFDEPEMTKMATVTYILQNKMIDLKDTIKAIKDAGTEIADKWNPYLQEELYHGRSAKRTQDFVKKELEPLLQNMRMRNVKMADFEEYLWARHAEERNIQIAKINPDMPDGGSGMTTADARTYMANLTQPQQTAYQALARQVDSINAGSRQILVDYGIESADTIAAWDGAYKNYVPLMREDMDAGFGSGTGQGLSVKGSASKRATGSNRAVVDIIANIAQQREKNIIRGEKNRVSTALIGLAKLNPNPDFWKTDFVPKIKTVSKNNVVIETPDPNYKNRDNVIVARILNKNGSVTEHSVMFNERNERAMRLASSMKGLDQDQLMIGLNTVAKATRYFSSINTQYNPIFGIMNLSRDIQGAALNLSSTKLAGKQLDVTKNIPGALKGIYGDLRKTRKGQAATSQWAQLFEEFQAEGGQTGYRDMFKNAQERSEALQSVIDPTYWQKSTLGKVLTANGFLATPEQFLRDKAAAPVFNWLSDYNEAVENSTRLAAYKVGLDNGLSKQEAASLAKNLTVNFNRKGQIAREAGSLFAFFNASAQGTARIFETLSGKRGKQIMAGGLLLGSMQALMLAAAGFDDEEPPEFIKDRNIVIPTGFITGKKDYITIPMPLGFNALPNFGRVATEWMMDGFSDTGKRTTNLLGMLFDVTNPIGNAGLSMQTITPTIIDPIAALSENRDFTGRPIAREDFNSLDKTPGFTRAKDTASTPSRLISEAINFLSGGNQYKAGALSPTPDQIDYLAGQVTGGVGRELLKADATITALATGENLPTYKVPLLGRFYGDSDNQSSQGAAYYKNIEFLNALDNELKGRRINNDGVLEFKANHPEIRALFMAKGIESQVGKLRKQKRQLIENDASKTRVKLIDEKITTKMKKLNERMKELAEQD